MVTCVYHRFHMAKVGGGVASADTEALFYSDEMLSCVRKQDEKQMLLSFLKIKLTTLGLRAQAPV